MVGCPGCRICPGHFRGGPRGNVGRGVPGHCLRGALRRPRSPKLAAGTYPVRSGRGVGTFPVRCPVVARHRSRFQLPALGPWRIVHRFRELFARQLAAVCGALPLRRVRAPRGGEILLALQPARGRHLCRDPSGHRPGHPLASAMAVAPGAPRAADLVRHRAPRVSPRAGGEHTPRACLQRDPAVRPPAFAEPEHDRCLRCPLRPLRRLARPTRGG